MAVRYAASPVTVLFAAVKASAVASDLKLSNGSPDSCVGEDTVGVAEMEGPPVEEPRRDGRAEEDLLDGDARRESVFRNADLRFGGGDGNAEGSMGSLGSFNPGKLSRSFPSISTSSSAVRVRVILCVGAVKRCDQ